MVLPTLELLVASLSAGLLIDFLAPRDQLSGSETELDMAAVFSVAPITAVSGVSGLVGLTRVQACRDFAEMVSLAADTTAQDLAEAYENLGGEQLDLARIHRRLGAYGVAREHLKRAVIVDLLNPEPVAELGRREVRKR